MVIRLSVSTEDAVTYYPPQPPGYGPYYQPPQWQPPPDALISPDYSGWFNRGVWIAKRGWMQLVGLQALGLVANLAAGAPFTVYFLRSQTRLNQEFGSTTPGQAPDLGPFFAVFGFELLAVLVAVIVTSLVTLASVHISVSVAIGAPARVSDALNLAARRLFPLIGWQLLAIPIYLAGLCACVLPIFYVAAVFAVLPAVVAIERTNVIGRCFRLFNRNVGLAVARIATIFGLGIGAAIVAFILSLVVRGATGLSLAGSGAVFGSGAVLGSGGSVAAAVISTLLSAVISAAVAVLTAPLTVAAYADMRARVEPTNTTVIAQQLGILPSPAQYWGPTG
jgi:hypothetical protein